MIATGGGLGSRTNMDRGSGNATHIQVQVGLWRWIWIALSARSPSPREAKNWAAIPALSAYFGFWSCCLPSKGLVPRGRITRAEAMAEYARAAPRRIKAFIVVKETESREV